MTSLWSKVAAFFKGGNASSGKTKKSIDGKNPPDFTVHRAARSYDEIELPDDRDEKPTVDYTVERKPRNYEEIVLPEDNRLSQGKQPVLNYVEVEFCNPPSNKIPVQRQDSKTEYADVIVKNKSIVVH